MLECFKNSILSDYNISEACISRYGKAMDDIMRKHGKFEYHELKNKIMTKMKQYFKFHDIISDHMLKPHIIQFLCIGKGTTVPKFISSCKGTDVCTDQEWNLSISDHGYETDETDEVMSMKVDAYDFMDIYFMQEIEDKNMKRKLSKIKNLYHGSFCLTKMTGYHISCTHFIKLEQQKIVIGKRQISLCKKMLWLLQLTVKYKRSSKARNVTATYHRKQPAIHAEE